MLNYWTTFRATYWELQKGQVIDAIDSPPRRDTVEPNNYAAGECAVDFVYNLVKEFSFGGKGYIPYTTSSNLRNTTYQTIALLMSLYQEEYDPAMLAEYSGLSLNALLQKITTDQKLATVLTCCGKNPKRSSYPRQLMLQ